jgi:DNA-binding NtrC family response regulator
MRYGWPGNIRELKNTIERAVLLCTGDAITREELPFEKMTSTLMPPVPAGAAPGLQDELDSVERTRVLEVLAQCQGNRTRAARMLGMARGTLLARLERYGVSTARRRKPRRR